MAQQTALQLAQQTALQTALLTALQMALLTALQLAHPVESPHNTPPYATIGYTGHDNIPHDTVEPERLDCTPYGAVWYRTV